MDASTGARSDDRWEDHDDQDPGTLVRLLLAVPLLAVGIALRAPSPAAATLICDTGTGQKVGGSFDGSVVVPENGRCDLRGSVTAAPGAAT